jgi:CDP-paratose 2-epimerase
MLKSAIVTGSSGLVGSAVCAKLDGLGYAVFGVDNNQRLRFFGPGGDTRKNQARLAATLPRFTHIEADIRDAAAIDKLFAQVQPAAVVHAAGQPSHDHSASIPAEDFAINAAGTVVMLDAARRHCPQSPFVFMSTNKVYGDNPNRIARREASTRWVLDDPDHLGGVKESMPIDGCTHSIFGASKVSADVMVQEYGRIFGMPTCCLRAGCITGQHHAGVELHGFLSYLVGCALQDKPYTVYGYGGKQVRDNIHADDLAAFIVEFIKHPRVGEVYNIGGGFDNTCSILEAVDLVERVTGRRLRTAYDDRARVGDHVVYYSNLSKIRSHFPAWSINMNLESIVREIAGAN